MKHSRFFAPVWWWMAVLNLAASTGVFGAESVVALDALDKPPERMSYRPAVFPADAPASLSAADVALTLVVDATGEVEAVEDVRAEDPKVAQAAREAAQGWSFRPATAGGKAVGFRLPVTIPLRRGQADYREVTELATEAVPIKPVYPEELRLSSLTGYAIVNVLVDGEGRASDAVVEFATQPEFEEPARSIVPQWAFYPAKKDGAAVASRATVRVTFDEQEQSKSADDLLIEALFEQRRSYDTPPEVIEQPPVVYPYEALIEGVTAKVTLNLIVDHKGRVVDANTAGGVPLEFAQAARFSVLGWRFKPATKAGREVFGLLGVELPFRDSAGEFGWDAGALELLAQLRAGTAVLVTAKQLDAPLKPLGQPKVVLPPDLAETAGAWEAVVETVIDTTGRCLFPRVVRASSPEIGWAAAAAVVKLRFEAPRKDGTAVVTRVRIPVQGKAGGGTAPATGAK